MNVPNAFKLPLQFPLREASGIFPILSGEKRGMPLWMKMLLPRMFQLSFADIPHPFTCMQRPRAVCNTASAQFGQPIIGTKLRFYGSGVEVACPLVIGKETGSMLCSLHGCSKSPYAEPKGWGSTPKSGSPKSVGVSASGLVCFRSSPAASKQVNLAQSSVTARGDTTWGTPVKQMKGCRVMFLLVSCWFLLYRSAPGAVSPAGSPPSPKESGLLMFVVVAVTLRICLCSCVYRLQKARVLHQAVPWKRGLMPRKYLSQRV